MTFRYRALLRVVRLAAVAAAAIGVAALLPPGSSGADSVAAPQDVCRNGAQVGRERLEHCEVRGYEFAPPSREWGVDGRMNGGVSVAGADRATVRVEAQVQAWARSLAQARAVAAAVTIRFPDEGGALLADGPESKEGEGWAVSYKLFVPRSSDLELKTHNGGVSVQDVEGRVRFDVVNGGVDLRRTGGDVQGRTVNGGLSIELAGDRWSGKGLDARTTNGGVQVRVPGGYNAEFRAETTNGKLRFDLPGSTQADIRGRLATTLGAGGPPVHVATTNGGVRVASR